MQTESSKRSPQSPVDGETANASASMTFESKKIGLQIQKKFLGSMSGRFARSALDDVSCEVLDNLYRILRSFYESKKVAESLVHGLIKVIVKLAVIKSTNQFDAFEGNVVTQFRDRFRTLTKTMVSFYQIDFTYDRSHLLGLFRDCERLLLQLKVRHLSDRSQVKIEEFFRSVGSPDLLDALFQDRRYPEQMGRLIGGLDKLMDQGLI